MSFLVKDKFDTKVSVLPIAVPQIYISSDAMAKMSLYVEGCEDEIGWLGTAIKNVKQNYIHITDMLLFDQEVHATTTEITSEGLSSFAEELLQQADGIDIWNNIKVWGHSHVKMGITPSGQDDKQMEAFLGCGHEWFIRIICNKLGALKVDLYEYALGITYLDLPWQRVGSAEEIEIERKIQELQDELDSLSLAPITLLKGGITEEIKNKVKKKSYTTAWTNGYGVQRSTHKNWWKGAESNAVDSDYDEIRYSNTYITRTPSQTTQLSLYPEYDETSQVKEGRQLFEKNLQTDDMIIIYNCADERELEMELYQIGVDATLYECRCILAYVQDYYEKGQKLAVWGE
jgi:hypothetical protein